jgi:tRNA uridine 5-carboxymethylaminomethyl modification enzyme
VIKGVGPRYCPSIEDKVMRFPDKLSHQIFIEPESYRTPDMYTQGFSTSLPADLQLLMVRSMPGLERAEILVPGYAVEYDFVYPDQLKRTLEHQHIKGLFFAGQICGTSGYEEAAGQGIVAGINAGLLLLNKEPLILQRSESYIGTMIDDLVTKEIREPYRMMTARSEYRLALRQDNADERLTHYGRKVGLINDDRYVRFLNKMSSISSEIERISAIYIKNNAENTQKMSEIGQNIHNKISLRDLLKRPNVSYHTFYAFDTASQSIPEEIRQVVAVKVKYEGYIARQDEQIRDFERSEKTLIPQDLDFTAIKGLRTEAAQKMQKIRPLSVGQAGRIAGVNPADIGVLLVWMEALKRGSPPAP